MEYLEQQELRIVRETARLLRISPYGNDSAETIRGEIFARFPIVDEPLTEFLGAMADQYRSDYRIGALQRRKNESAPTTDEAKELELLLAGRGGGDGFIEATRAAVKKAIAASGIEPRGAS